MTLEGKLFLFSETGTEGGHWAFQDSQYISWEIATYGLRDGLEVRDVHKNRIGKISDCEILPGKALTRATIAWSDGTIESKRQSDTLLIEQWNYKGLHILKNGNYLTILHPTERTTVWDGIIDLKPNKIFTEHANGMWIHADQNGISREEWSEFFFKSYPALLQKKS